MIKWLRRLFARKGLRSVPGAGGYRDENGRIAYNLLDPFMQQFLGRCVGAIKRSGLRVKGTGQFTVLLGEGQDVELLLDDFWAEYSQTGDEGVLERVVSAAKGKLGLARPGVPGLRSR